jgi:hypothetical protein
MSSIEKNVMANVALIYTMRKLLSRTALECYALILSLFGIATLASLPHVLQNFSAVARGGLGGISVFTLSAVQHTTLAVQLLLALGIVAVFLLALDFIRSTIFLPQSQLYQA